MNNQQSRMLHALRKAPVRTGYARNVLGIGDPATRVFELKQQGWKIDTEMVEVRAPRNVGGTAWVAEYTLPDTPGNLRKLRALDRQREAESLAA